MGLVEPLAAGLLLGRVEPSQTPGSSPLLRLPVTQYRPRKLSSGFGRLDALEGRVIGFVVARRVFRHCSPEELEGLPELLGGAPVPALAASPFGNGRCQGVALRLDPLGFLDGTEGLPAPPFGIEREAVVLAVG